MFMHPNNELKDEANQTNVDFTGEAEDNTKNYRYNRINKKYVLWWV